MKCPKCGGENINFQMVQTGANTKSNKRGCLWELGRMFLIICTLGLWLVIGKSKGKSKTKFTNEKMAICQSCGHTWKA